MYTYIYICYLFGLPRKKMGVQKNPLFGLGGEAVVRCPFEVGGVSEEKKQIPLHWLVTRVSMEVSN